MMPPAVRDILEREDHALLRDWSTKARMRWQDSETYWNARHEDWREQEHLYRAFRVPDSEDKKSSRNPITAGVKKIVVPYGYAVLQSTLAFFMTAFTQRKPIIPVEGVGPNDTRAAILHELLLDYQLGNMQPQGVLALYQWLLDGLRYGVGIVKNLWVVREWPDVERKTVPIVNPFTMQAEGYEDTLIERDVVAYEGNEWANVSPFDFYPDPSQPLARFQDGEFVFHRMKLTWTQLEQKEAQGLYAGLRFVPRQNTENDRFGGDSDLSRIMKMGERVYASSGNDNERTGSVDVKEGWIYIKPQEWKIPEAQASNTNRLWVITLVGDRVVRLEPANLPGRRFPFEAIEPNYDCHSPANFGQIETFRGLQDHLSWLFNSRMQSVRKTLNNQWVYDPSMVEENDILGENQGQLIRLKRQHWQSGAVKEAVYPLPIQDVTQGHLASDMPIVKGLAEEIHGANKLLMGMGNTGRRAATEVQATANYGAGRMKMLLEIISAQGLRPLVSQMTRNNQTFVDGPLSLRKPYADMFGSPVVQLTPDLLKGEFLYPFHEGGIPTEKQAEVAVLKELLQYGMQAGVPDVVAMMPWRALMSRWLWQMGFKDLSTWGLSVRDISVQPEEMVQQQMQAGNLVPGAPPDTTRVPSDGFAMPAYESVPGA